MADVFISYSRKDRDFVLRLHEALAKANRDAWIDWHDIPLTADFLREIHVGIEGCDKFVFVITPDSISSPICQKEIGHAAANNKRLIPVFHRFVTATEVPGPLCGLNWIFFRDTDNFESTFASLIDALDTDLDWKRTHTRLLQRAAEWEAKGCDASLVLRGADLEEAVQWLGQAPNIKKQKPAELHLKYINSSQEREAEELRKARRQSRKLRRLLWTLATLLLIAASAALIARRQQLTALSRALAAQAEQTVSLDRPAALTLAIRSLRTAKTTEAKLAVAHAFPQLLATLQHDGGVGAAAFSPNGLFIVTASDKSGWVWLADDGTLFAKLEGHRAALSNAAFSPDSRAWSPQARTIPRASGTLSHPMKKRRFLKAGSFRNLRVIPIGLTTQPFHPTASASSPRARTIPRASGTRPMDGCWL
jgi:hypothetical protein